MTLVTAGQPWPDLATRLFVPDCVRPRNVTHSARCARLDVAGTPPYSVELRDAKREAGVLKLWAYVLAYPYLAMFSLTVVEGPLAMVTSGMLVASGVMTFLAAVLLAVAADVGADSAYFLAGRLARRSTSTAASPGCSPGSARPPSGARDSRHRCSAAWPGSCSAPRSSTARRSRDRPAGGVGVRYPTFLRWNLVFTVPKATLLLLVGALIGDRIRPYLTPANGILFAAAGVTAWLSLLGVRRLLARRQPA